MTALIRAVVGITAMPFTGAVPCGYMREVNHDCEEVSCPLMNSLVMVFDPRPAQAILACRQLWEHDDQEIIIQRLKVTARTLQITNRKLEYGLLHGRPADWAYLRAMIVEHDKPVVQLRTVGALLSFGGSPGEMWTPMGSPMIIPAHAEPQRAELEDRSWWGQGLDHPDDLIDDIDGL